MSTTFTIALWVIALVLIGLRFVVPALPLRRHAVPMGGVDLALLGIGMLGLVLHCTAMFHRPVIDWIPGIEPVLQQINDLGTASVIWYVIPAVLVLVALRRQHLIALLAVAVALAAVGITMYNGASLAIHLGTILALVVVLGAVTSALVGVGRAPSRASA